MESHLKYDQIAPDIQAFVQQTLSPMGWVESLQAKLPIDANGNPLPWWTYSAIEFVSTLARPDFRVFEYGGGQSTLWWASQIARVTTIDHDQEWVDKVAPSLVSPHEILCVPAESAYSAQAEPLCDAYFQRSPRCEFPYDDARVKRRGLNDTDFVGYVDAINHYPEQFDCIVIDGMARRLCAYFAVEKLKDDGIIIFDNSNRSDYLEGYQYLTRSGFFQIRLWGTVAGATFPSCTSIFVRKLQSLPKLDFQSSLFDFPEY
ncbi:MAG: hypothetical protein WBA10_09850 [Elainellaceae cyanobacterium]